MKRFKGQYRAQLIINIDASYGDDEKTYSIAEARMRLLNIMTNGWIRLLNGHMGNKGTVALVDPSVELHEVVEGTNKRKERNAYSASISLSR